MIVCKSVIFKALFCANCSQDAPARNFVTRKAGISNNSVCNCILIKNVGNQDGLIHANRSLEFRPYQRAQRRQLLEKAIEAF